MTTAEQIAELIATGSRENYSPEETTQKIVKLLADSVTLEWVDTTSDGCYSETLVGCYGASGKSLWMPGDMGVPSVICDDPKADALSHHRAQLLKLFGLVVQTDE